MRLLLAPHAPTDWNAELRFQGHSDTPLSETGRLQAALLGQRLATEEIHEVHCSDLRRAWETALAVAVPRRVPLRTDARLRELDFGAWEGLTHDEIAVLDPDRLAAWQADMLQTPPPGGETLANLADRVGAFLTDLRAQVGPERTVLVVAHRGSLQVLLCLILGLPPWARWQFRLEPASLTELDLYPEGAILTRLNDTHHLGES
jgi:broad specificity phosphatase PhoE